MSDIMGQDWNTVIAVFSALFSLLLVPLVTAWWTARQNREASEKLAKQQQAYTAQIEALKNQLAFSLARKSKFAEKEFEVLANCWKEIGKVRFAAIQVESHGVQNFRDSYIKDSLLTELAEFTSKQCKENLAVSEELSEKEKSIIAEQEPGNRALYFSHYVLRFYRLKYTNNLKEFVDYFSDNRIFLSLKIQAEFQNIWLSCASIVEKAGELADKFSDIEGIRPCLEEINKQLPSLIEDMHSRFWKLERVVAEQLFPEEVGETKKEKQNDA